jgi:hopanoid biosynthesis associated RND transporter like protein HpnN
MKAEELPAHDETFVHRLLARVVLLVASAPWLVLTVCAALTVASVYLACTRLQYRTQRDDLISQKKECQQRWLGYLKEFGQDDDMVVVVKGNERRRMTAALEALAEKIQKDPDHFDRLFYKVDLRSLHDRALLFLDPAEIEQIRASVERMKPLLDVPLAWQMFTLRSLYSEASLRLALLAPGQALSAGDEQFLAQLRDVTRSAAGVLHDPRDYRSPWKSLTAREGQKDRLAEPQYFFSSEDPSSKPVLAFLLVRPVTEAGSFTGALHSVEKLHELIAETRPGFTDLEIGLTGLPVLETDEMLASQNDTNAASWIALAGVAMLYLLVFRGLRYPLLTVATLLVGTAWALGWLTLTVGHLNILSATFAVMLIGMGDYGVLWVTRYDQERQNGADIRAALRTTGASVGHGILTAGTTAALAFYATMLADFQAVAELGWIAGSGVLLCALACFTVLPALLVVTRRWCKPETRQPETLLFDPQQQDSWIPSVSRRPGWVIGVSLAVTLVLGVFALRVRYDHNLLNMQAEELESVQWERTLIEHTAGASWHALSIADTREKVFELKARFEQMPEVDRVVEIASLVPGDQERKLPLLRDIHERLRQLPPRNTVIPHPKPDMGALLMDTHRLLEQLHVLTHPSAQQTEPPAYLRELETQLAMLKERLHRALDGGEAMRAEAVQRLQDFEHWLTADLAEDLHRLHDVTIPDRIQLTDLPVALRERYVSPHGKWLLRVFGKDCLWDFEPLANFTAAIQKVDPAATGKPFTTLEGLQAMKSGFEWAGLYALGAIVLVLALDFRRVLPLALSLAPLAMGVLLSLGFMGLCGMPLNPANMIAFPLIVGVGVDNGVHVLHDYLSRDRGTPYRLRKSTGKGMFVAALTTVLGFGTLMISRHRGMYGLGFILALGVTWCMLAALVFLPAVLHLWSKRRLAQQAARQESEATIRRAA